MRNRQTRAGVLACGAVLIGLGGALLAQVRGGGYTDGKGESIAQIRPPLLAPDAEYSVTSFPALPANLADGDGRAETESFCSGCHSTRYVTMQPPLPAAVWEAEMNKMIKPFGAQIPEASAKKILAYLQAHYTPENRKQ